VRLAERQRLPNRELPGVEVLRTTCKGPIDSAAVAQLRGVDLERYRKRLWEAVRINLPEAGDHDSESRPGRSLMRPCLGLSNFHQFQCSGGEVPPPCALLDDCRPHALPDAGNTHLVCRLLLAARVESVLAPCVPRLERLIGATEPINLGALADFIAPLQAAGDAGPTRAPSCARCPSASAPRCCCATAPDAAPAASPATSRSTTSFPSAAAVAPTLTTSRPCAAAATAEIDTAGAQILNKGPRRRCASAPAPVATGRPLRARTA
jgi:hypothetical protein